MTNENDHTGTQVGNYRLVAQMVDHLWGGVYLAEHVLLPGRRAVVKWLHTDPPKDAAEYRERLLHEARFLDLLTSPYIIPLLDAGWHEGLPYLVTAYAPHGTLRDRIERQGGVPLPVEETLPILSQIGHAVHYAHFHNVLHGDLTPGNILFNKNGEAVLADFGHAQLLPATSSSQAVPGSLQYMAPEKLDGILCPEGDQYALGCIAYELLAGRQPFTAFSLRELVHKHIGQEPIPPSHFNLDLPVHVEQAILTAMAKAPTDRHANVASFITSLGGAAYSSQSPFPLSSEAGPALPQASIVQKTGEQWLDEGLTCYQDKRYTEALVAYEQALALDPDDGYAALCKGLVLCDLTCYSEALTVFEWILERNSGEAYAYIGKGFALRALERYQEALAAYEQALTLDPENAEACLGRDLVLDQVQQTCQ